MVSQTDEVRKIGDIGGQPKMTYWTPDGRVIRAMPDMHEYTRIQGNKIVENGLRDANLDKGWLTIKPDTLKPYCEGCDKWHDTQEEVDACIKHKKVFIEHWEKKAPYVVKETESKGDEKIAELEVKIGALTRLIERIMEQSNFLELERKRIEKLGDK